MLRRTLSRVLLAEAMALSQEKLAMPIKAETPHPHPQQILSQDLQVLEEEECASMDK